MGAVQLGPFIIHYTWMFLLLSGVITYVVLKKVLNQKSEFRDPFLDLLLFTVIIAIVVNKVSILLFRPELWTKNPIVALSLMGTWRENGVALIVSLCFFIRKWKNQMWPVLTVVRVILFGLLSFLTSYWLMRTVFFLFSG